MLHDLAIGLKQRFGIERSLSKEHLVETDAEGPPVTLLAIHTLPILHGLWEGEKEEEEGEEKEEEEEEEEGGKEEEEEEEGKEGAKGCCKHFWLK